MGIYNYINKINSKYKRKTAIAMVMDNGEMIKYTYGRLFEEAGKYASQLTACGIKAGDRIIIAAENSPQWQVAFLAIMKVKATAVLIDASLGEKDLKQLIEKSDARCMYVSHKVKEKIGASPAYRIPVLDLKAGGRPYKDSYRVLSPFIERTKDPDLEVAMIIYSSGTTRSAAGIMHTHQAMINTIRMTVSENELMHYDRILSLLPNSHIYGVVTCLLGSMMLGASVCYVESINNETILNAFKMFKPTIFPCVPKVFELFEKQIIRKIEAKESTKRLFEYFYPICYRMREQTGIRFGKLIFRSVHKGFGGKLSLMTSAGAPLDEKVAAFYYAMGFDLLITYGLTETNIPIIGNRGDNVTIDSCGTPYPKMDVQLIHLDETGEGEICVRSPYMMKGYFRDQESTLAAFDEDGWFRTGDLARLDEYGNVKITGRSKENIVLATGKKVAPSDIENHYTEIPGVDELIISGVPISGEHDEVHAFVVKKGLHLEESHIRQAIQERGEKLAQYMKVAKVHFLEEIPKTALQKPKRYLLKKYALETDKETETVSVDKEMQELKMNESEMNSLEKIEQSLYQLVMNETGLDKNAVTLQGKLISKVGIDSLAAIEIALKVEAEYKVNIQELLKQDACITEIARFIQATQNEGQEGKAAAQKEGQEITVNAKTKLHYGIFKACTLLAHLLYKVKVTYKKPLPEDKGYIICANHVSNIDYLWIAQSFDETRFSKLCCMAKKELFTDSKITHLLRDVSGMIPVDRGSMNYEIMKLCKKQLQDNWGLIIHPEGTRSHDGELGTFKKGAATIAKDAGVPIIPTYIKGGHDIFPRGRKLPKFFNFETKRRYEVEVIFGEPIYPGEYSVEELIQKVQEAVEILKDGESAVSNKADINQDTEILSHQVLVSKEEEKQEESCISEEDVTPEEKTAQEEALVTEIEKAAEEETAVMEEQDTVLEEVTETEEEKTEEELSVREQEKAPEEELIINQEELIECKEETDIKLEKNGSSVYEAEITLKDLLEYDYEIDIRI